MTASEAAEIVAMLIQAYPQAQFAPASSALYESQIVDLDAASCLVAVQRIIRSSRWLPTVAEIRAVESEIRFGRKRLGMEAWADVIDAVRRVGMYRPPPKFKDPAVGHCVRLMGWQNLCLSTNDAADRARFVELYDGLEDRRWTDAVIGLPASPEVRSLLNEIGRRLPMPRLMSPAEAHHQLADFDAKGGKP